MTHTKEEITDKILEKIKSYYPHSYNVSDGEAFEKAISLTLAECQKQNSDFVKKLKEEIVKSDFIVHKRDEHGNEWREVPLGVVFDKINTLAKEFGIKQVGEE